MGPRQTGNRGGMALDAEPTATRSSGELVANLGETMTRLLRHEVALARSDTRSEVQAAARAVGSLVVAGGLGLVALILLSLACARGLSAFMGLAWAYAVVGAALAAIAGIVLARRRRILVEVNPVPPRTRMTLLEIPDAMS